MSDIMTNLQKLQEYSAKCQQIKHEEGLLILQRFQSLLPKELQEVFKYEDPYTDYDGETIFYIVVDDFRLKVKYNSKTKVYRIDGELGMLWSSNYTDFHQLTDYIINQLKKQLNERIERAQKQAREYAAKL